MGGNEFVERIDQKLQEYQTPIAAYWLQDWVGRRVLDYGTRLWWNWELNEYVYPDWSGLKERLSSRDIKLMAYINPYLTNTEEMTQHSFNMFQYASEQGYLFTNRDDEVIEIDSLGFTAGIVDFTNKDAYGWLKDHLVETALEHGFDGWMADFGEALPYEAQPYDSEVNMNSYHNEFILDWAKFNRDVSDEIDERRNDGSRFVSFMRNATTNSAQYTDLFWLGDQMGTWEERDGLRSSINGLLSGGLSGMANNHSDIGGIIAQRQEFLGVPLIVFQRTQNLFKRWAEANAFTAVYRTHDGNNAHLSHKFYDDPLTMKHFVYFAKVFTELFEYRKELFIEASETGMPIARHMMLHYPDDENSYTAEYQYMLGPDFLVAPIVEKRRDDRDVYLPQGEWIHLWTGQVIESEGDYYHVPAPLGKPPVFYISGSSHGENLRNKIIELGEYQEQ